MQEDKELVAIFKIDMKFVITAIVLFLLLADFGSAQPGVFDISKFGGAPNADITQVLFR